MNATAPAIEDLELDRPHIFSLADLLDDYSAQAIAAFDHKRKGTSLGPTTPLRDLNAALGGYFRPGIYILHAAPGAGKSMLSLQLAAQCGFPAVFVSTEMDRVENVARLMAMATNTPRKALLSGTMDIDAELGILQATAAQFPKLTIGEALGIPLKPSVIRQWVYVNQGAKERHSMLVIDSLHSWAFSVVDSNDATEKQILDTALKHLRQISKDLKIPIIVIAERNRYSMDRGGMSAASGSARIEFGADVVMELNPEKKTYNDAEPIPGQTGRMMVLKLSKNRFGEPKSVKLFFDPAVMKFSSTTTEAYRP